MIKKLLCFIIMLCAFNTVLLAQTTSDAQDNKIQQLLNSHYQNYKDQEYFSGISLSIYKPGQDIKNYFVGTVSHNSNKKIDTDTLFQIGSISKSFTAAIMLQLEKENKLHLNDLLKQWLPIYDKWSSLTLNSLLNMTSGLPNYSDSPLINASVYFHPDRNFTNMELIEMVYPPHQFSPPLKSGYMYCNTGYILSAIIIEKISKEHFHTVIYNRLIKPAHLENTFYPLPALDNNVIKRIASGYGYNQYMNPELVGKDTRLSSLSWAGAAGAIISNSADIIKWIKTLFVDNNILDSKQKAELMQLVSTTSGKPIKTTNSKEPRGFGLGVIQAYDKTLGQYWFYEGQTEGFRALYMYVPKTGIIIASIFNSSTNEENDHAGELMKKVYLLVSSPD